MAKAGKPTGSKGLPVMEPSRATEQTDELVAMNFKVAPEFRREFKLYAVERGKTMVELLKEAFEEYRENHR